MALRGPPPPPPRGAKRPPSDRPPLPAPSTARRRTESGRQALGAPRFTGHVLSYDQGKGYGFITCDEVPEGDIYFQRQCLPPDAQSMPRGALKGQAVEFTVFLTPDGKPRADMIRVLAGGKGAPRAPDLKPAAPLDEAQVDEMTKYLEERGGSMDFGKFTRDFKGVKKSQLEPYFTLMAEEDDAGGRWQIMLPGLGPPPPEAIEPKEEKAAEPDGPREDTPLGHFVGDISLFDPAKGYGFIKSEEVPEGDVYFRRAHLPAEAQHATKAMLVGAAVEFDCHLTPQGKARAESLKLLGPLPEASPEAKKEKPSAAPGDGAAKKDKVFVPAPALDDEAVQEMESFLEGQGGAMDYGKFANAFPGVKKSQLEGHFTLVQEGEDAGGRWQITLPGVDPLPPGRDGEKEPRYRPGGLEPSETLWLTGFIKKWDQKKNFGFIAAEGVDDVFMHRNDMPPELQAWRGSLLGVEVAFQLEAAEAGKMRAVSVRGLLRPDGRGGWQLRRG